MYNVWTQSARDCYQRHKTGIRCKGCFYEDFFTRPTKREHITRRDYVSSCNMKNVIIELVKTIGLPD